MKVWGGSFPPVPPLDETLEQEVNEANFHAVAYTIPGVANVFTMLLLFDSLDHPRCETFLISIVIASNCYHSLKALCHDIRAIFSKLMSHVT